MTKDEALKQAREWIKAQPRGWMTDGFKEVIADINEALAQPAQEPRLDQGPDYERGFVDGRLYQTQTSVDKAVNAIAQPAQKPVAEFKRSHHVNYPLLTWIDDGYVGKVGDKLYAAPPQRPWVGLTDEDWDEIFGNSLTIGAAIKNTEATLKEKNT